MSEIEQQAGMRCMSMRIENKPLVIAAAEASGQAVEWRDEPDERMPAHLRDQYGSIWSNETDLSEFWRCFRGAQHQNG